MSNKITLTELADILSVNSKLMSKKSDWENFLRLLFTEVSNALYQDKIVKIKGLGTFKLVMVEPRKSVNIKTGEAVIIPSHAKISFTPDANLAAVINKPYSHLEVTTLSQNGPVDPEEKEELENDILPNYSANTSEEIKVEISTKASSQDSNLPTGIVKASERIAKAIEKINNITDTDEQKNNDEDDQTENNNKSAKDETSLENITDENKSEEPSENKIEVENKDNEPTKISKEEEKTETVDSKNETTINSNPEEQEKNNKKSNSKKLGIAIIIIVCFLSIFAAILWISDPNIVNKIRNKISYNSDTYNTEVPVVTLDTTNNIVKTDTISEAIKDSLIEDISNNEVIIDEDIKSKSEQNTEEKNDLPQPSIIKKNIHFRDDFMKYMEKKHPSIDLSSDNVNEEEIGKGDRLTLVSLRNYGQKDFWVYLYLYNYDIIKNPNNVKPGTKIKIPALSTSLVNPDSEECINLAREIKAKFVKN